MRIVSSSISRVHKQPTINSWAWPGLRWPVLMHNLSLPVTTAKKSKTVDLYRLHTRKMVYDLERSSRSSQAHSVTASRNELKKLWREDIILYSTFSWELTCKALRMAHANVGSHSFTCHPHVYPRMEWAILPFLPPQCIIALWTLRISRPTESRRLS